jgi:hypothetical protein
MLGPITVNLPPGTTGWFRHQNVPASAMPGLYHYIGCAGLYSTPVWSSDTLIYTKLTTGSGPLVGDWANTGEPFAGEAIRAGQALPLQVGSVGINPNPFNPTTTLSYELQTASFVTLKVYDTAGRLVSVLVDGWREAGIHEVTFDGSALASGIYLAKLNMSGSGAIPTTIVRKMVLLK